MTGGTRPWAKAGVMIKASAAPGSAYAAMLVTGSNGVRMQWDYTGDSAGLPGNVSASSPRWLRLVRSGSTVTGFESLNGTSWTRAGSYRIHGLPASGTVLVGLFAASPSSVVYSTTGIGSRYGYEGPSNATGTFGDVALTGTSRSGSWTGTDVGSSTPGSPQAEGPPGVNFNGSYTQAGPSSFTVTGAGEIAPDVPGGPDGIGASVQVALSGVFFALIVVIILGGLFMSAEYRRGMIRVTLAAAPSRTTVLAAKSVVIFLATFVTGLLAAGFTLTVGLHMLRSGGNPVDPIPALTEARMVVGPALLLAVAAVLALAIAAMVRRSVIAILAVIAIIFIPYILVTGANLLPLTIQEWLQRVLPVAAFSVEQAYPAYHQVYARTRRGTATTRWPRGPGSGC